MYVRTPMLVVMRPKDWGVWHYGIQRSDGVVAHCYPNQGVILTSMEAFAEGQPVSIEREIPPAQLAAVIQRITVALTERRPYNPLAWNCETFANWAIGARPESAQVQQVLNKALIGAAGVALVGLCVAAFAGDS